MTNLEDRIAAARSYGYIATPLDADHWVYWPVDYSGVIHMSLDDGSQVSFNVVNGQRQ